MRADIKDWVETATREDLEEMSEAAKLCSRNLYASATWCNDEQGAREATDKIRGYLDTLAEMADKELAK